MPKLQDERLKLIAEDNEDLVALSAHLQDAILRVGDIAYLPKTKRLALTLNRFCWERAAEKLEGRDVYRRVTSGLHLDNVFSVQARGIDRSNPEGLLVFLAAKIEPGEKFDTVELAFSGGATLRAEVEALEISLSDLNAGWLTDVKPAHDARAEPNA